MSLVFYSQLISLIVILLLVMVNGLRSLHSIDSLFEVQSNDFHITSCGYDPKPHIPDWVQRTFGKESVFFDKTNPFASIKEMGYSSYDTLIEGGRQRFQNHVNSSLSTPLGHVKLLGYVSLDAGYTAFKRDKRGIAPIVGKAKLTVQGELELSCQYRALFENWRGELEEINPSYWSIIFYCPIHDIPVKELMTSFQRQQQTTQAVAMKLVLPLTNAAVINHSFRVKLDIAIKKQPLPSLNLGICTAIPYTTIDNKKFEANALMFLQWIRYYTMLGIKVFVYDRDGAHQSRVNKVLQTESLLTNQLIYYNYTIRGLLDPSQRGLQYDNNELSTSEKRRRLNNGLPASSRGELQRHDKVNTLTHCRFEAMVTHGIENMIIADFDEFLYCPKAVNIDISPAENQLEHLSHLIWLNFAKMKVDQMVFPQLVVANKTSSTRDCMIEKVHNKESSILDCFASYKYPIDSHSYKSIAVGYKCPLTGYHLSCGLPGHPATHDCSCRTMQYHKSDKQCYFIHLSTKKSLYEENAIYSSPQQQDAIKASRTEIYDIIYPKHP